VTRLDEIRRRVETESAPCPTEDYGSEAAHAWSENSLAARRELARTDVPYLLAELDAALRRIDDLTETLEGRE
jgi:hypothetical protein